MSEVARRLKQYWLEAMVMLVVLVPTVVRLRLLRFPLERDEGEYACMGQLLLHGAVPFKIAYSTQKLPGTHFAYAFIMAIFGQSVAAIHFGLLLVNLATCAFIFFIAKRLYGRLAGAVACAGYAVMSVSPTVLGTAAHATHFVMLAALGGFLVLLGTGKSWSPVRLYSGGLLLGVAFVMRQPALLFVAFGLVYFWIEEIKARGLSYSRLVRGSIVYLFGAALPFALLCAIIAAGGAFTRFWHWTFVYVWQYASEVTLPQGAQIFAYVMRNIVWFNLGTSLFAAVGLICLFVDQNARRTWFFTLGFLAVSFLTICPGFYFREHYFVQLLPAIAIFAGIGVNSLAGFLTSRNAPAALRIFPAMLFMFGAGLSLYQQRVIFFEYTPEQACRAVYGPNPFPEAVEIAKYLRSNTSDKDTIAVIGSEAEIYFYAHRIPATGYIFTYALMEPHPMALKMQEEMVSEIEASAPKYVVMVNVRTSWLPKPKSHMEIFGWSRRYLDSGYQIAGVVDILNADETKYRWGADAVNYHPQSEYNVTIWKRKS